MSQNMGRQMNERQLLHNPLSAPWAPAKPERQNQKKDKSALDWNYMDQKNMDQKKYGPEKIKENYYPTP